MSEPIFIRDHVVSVRLTGEESAYLEQLTDVHLTDRSSMIRHLILSAPLWSRPECTCDLIDTSYPGGPPSYVRGRSNGCLRHFDSADAEARRKARE